MAHLIVTDTAVRDKGAQCIVTANRGLGSDVSLDHQIRPQGRMIRDLSRRARSNYSTVPIIPPYGSQISALCTKITTYCKVDYIDMGGLTVTK